MVDHYIIFLNQCLGAGSYGKVFKAINKLDKNSQQFAVKIINKSSLSKDQYIIQAIMNQISIMKKPKSIHVLKMHGVCQTNNNYYIFQQLCQGGDLRKLISKNKKGFQTNKAIQYLSQILHGYIQLIKIGIIHRDLKPQNILIYKQILKIADFGFAKIINNRNIKMNSFVGTPLYMSPQVMQQFNYTSKCDIWSIGIIFYEMLHGMTPWIAKNQFELLHKIEKIRNIDFKDEIPEKVKQFIRNCLKYQQQDRISFQQIYTHQIFNNRFIDQIGKIKNLQQKSQYIINKIRFKVLSNNIDLLVLFKEYDFSKDTKLNKKEFYKLLLSIDNHITKQQVLYLFEKFDVNNNGFIQFQEFKEWLEKNQINLTFPQPLYQNMQLQKLQMYKSLAKIKKISQKLSLIQIFKIFDLDDSQQLDQFEFAKMLKQINSEITQQECKLTFQKFDLNNDKKISFEQFKIMFAKIVGKPLRNQKFQQRINNIDKQLQF